MLKLIKLEWKKNNIKKYIRNVLILLVLLSFFIFSLAFLGIANDKDGTLDAVQGADKISSSIELFTSISYLIFTSAMLASFIVSSYKNKTINLMFSYPIKRQKILAAQMMSVWIFNFIALFVTKFILYLIIFIGSHYMQSSFKIDFNIATLDFYIQLLLKSIVIVSMGFIALFVGMAMKSSKATVIASFLLIFLTQANVGDFSMADNRVFPVLLTVVSLIFAPLTVFNAETKDLI